MTHFVNFVITNLRAGNYRRSERFIISRLTKVHVKERRDEVETVGRKPVQQVFHATSRSPFVICVPSLFVRDGVERSEVRIYESRSSEEVPNTSELTLSLQERRRIEKTRRTIENEGIVPGTKAVVGTMSGEIPITMRSLHLEEEDPHFVGTALRGKKGRHGIRFSLSEVLEIR